MAKPTMSPSTIVIVSLLLISLAGMILTAAMPQIREMFGAQGGEMVQLAAGHVPTAEDLREMQEEQRQVRKEIVNMTGYW